MEQKPDCLRTKWTRSPQSIPPFTREFLERKLTGDTSQTSPKAKQPNAHKHTKYGYQLFKDKMVSKVKVITDGLHLKGRLFPLNEPYMSE